MWQEIAIWIIGALAVGYMARKIYRVFRRGKGPGGCHCGGCSGRCGCPVKNRPPKGE